MSAIDSPFTVFAVALVVQGLAVYAGDFLRRKVRPLGDKEREDLGIVRAASLTLLGLIIGFTFAMAVSRYDQRKNMEEAEANAIGTEYLRADLLPANDASHLRELLRKYTEQRISFYETRDERQIERIGVTVEKLHADLWTTVVRATTGQQTPLAALAVAGMNDVLNSQGYTQAAWSNRIPIAAWALMGLIAISCCLLVGYGEHRTRGFLLVLPLIVSISFFLIADIDSPRGGVIRVTPYNLISQYHSLKPN